MLKIVLALAISICLNKVTSEPDGGMIFCYYNSRAALRPGLGRITPNDLNPHLCKIITYATFGVSSSFQIIPADYENENNRGNLKSFIDLKMRNPDVKLLATIGRTQVTSSTFSQAVRTEQSRDKFVCNIVDFCKTNGFDGADIEWEFPGLLGGESFDKRNFVLFLKQLRKAFDKENYILVVTTSINKSVLETSYDLRKIAKHVHYVNPETCHYHTTDRNVTGQTSPLYPSEVDTDRTLNVDASIRYYRENGVPTNKINLGIASFGISFTLADENLHSVGDPSLGAGIAGPFTQTSGLLSYTEVCREFRYNPIWTRIFDNTQKNPYAFKGNQWIGYDSPRSVRIKAKYSKQKQLAGLSFWSMDMDDVKNICGDGKWPMLETINEVFGRSTWAP